MPDSQEQILSSIKPHWLSAVLAVVWYVVFVTVPIMWWHSFGVNVDYFIAHQDSVINAYLVYVVLATIYMAASLYVWLGNKAYLTSERLILRRPGWRKDKWWAIPLNTISRIAVSYPTRIYHKLDIGSLSFSSDQESGVLRLISHPTAVLEKVASMAQGMATPTPPIIEAVVPPVTPPQEQAPIPAPTEEAPLQSQPIIDQVETPAEAPVAQNITISPVEKEPLPEAASASSSVPMIPETEEAVAPDTSPSPELVMMIEGVKDQQPTAEVITSNQPIEMIEGEAVYL